MRTAKFLFNLYLDASFHVSLAVASFTVITCFFLGISYDFYLLGFVFFATVVCYNFVKYGVEAHKYLVVSNRYHRIIQILSFISFGLGIFFLWHLSTSVWIAVAGLGLISTLYAVPMLPNAKNLRSLGGFKIYIIAFVWTGFTVLLPVLNAHMEPIWDLGVLSLQRFILVLVLIIPFEIRDMKWDDSALKTLPQVIGPRKAQNLGLVLLGIFFLMTFLKDTITTKEIVFRLLLTLFLVPFFLVDQSRQSKYFSSFWVEGIPIVWVLVILLSETIG